MKASPGLRQLPDGRWRFLLYTAGRKDGPRVQVTLPKGTTRTEAEATYRAAVAKAAARRGRPIPRRLTFADAAAEYLGIQRGRLAPGTLVNVENIVNRLVSLFGDRRVEDLRPSDVVGYQAARVAADVMPSTVNGEVVYLLAIVRKVLALGWIERDPLPRGSFDRLPTPSPETVFFRAEEWAAFMHKLEELRPDAAPAFRALLLLACRIGELSGLTWGSFDLDGGRVTIAQPKRRGRVKTLPLAAELREVLDSLERGLPAAPVFLREDGSPWDGRQLQRLFYRVRDAAGLRKALHPHSIRHTAASWAVQSGVPLLSVKETLGHANISQTVRYSHLETEHLRGAVEAVSTVEKSGRRHRGATDRG